MYPGEIFSSTRDTPGWRGWNPEVAPENRRNPADIIVDAKRARIFRQLGDLTAPELSEVEAAIKRIQEARVNG